MGTHLLSLFHSLRLLLRARLHLGCDTVLFNPCFTLKITSSQYQEITSAIIQPLPPNNYIRAHCPASSVFNNLGPYFPIIHLLCPDWCKHLHHRTITSNDNRNWLPVSPHASTIRPNACRMGRRCSVFSQNITSLYPTITPRYCPHLLLPLDIGKTIKMAIIRYIGASVTNH